MHRVAPVAAADLDDIWHYVATERGGIETANRLIDAITERFVLLANFPFLGRARDDDFGAGCRSLAAGDNVIVYCLEADDVLILRVAHGRRDIEALFGR